MTHYLPPPTMYQISENACWQRDGPSTTAAPVSCGHSVTGQVQTWQRTTRPASFLLPPAHFCATLWIVTPQWHMKKSSLLGTHGTRQQLHFDGPQSARRRPLKRTHHQHRRDDRTPFASYKGHACFIGSENFRYKTRGTNGLRTSMTSVCFIVPGYVGNRLQDYTTS